MDAPDSLRSGGRALWSAITEDHDLVATHTQQDVELDKLYVDVAVYNSRVMGPAHTRNVMELARQRGIKVIERHIKPEELKQVSEVFLTGTAAEVTPVGQIGEQAFAVGPVTKQLMEDYGKAVRA